LPSHAQKKGFWVSSAYPDSREEVGDVRARSTRVSIQGHDLERDRSDVLDSARPLPPDGDVVIDDLTEDEDRLFLAAILEA